MQLANEPPTLLITGSSGYIGTHIVGLALREGYHVRACIRSRTAVPKLEALFPEGHERLSFAVVENFTEAESYRFALYGVTTIVHAASPFNFDTKNMAKELLQPAIKGSVAILEAAKDYGPQCKRIINISSFGAMVDMAQGLRPGYVYSNKDWNPMSYEEAAASESGGAAYCASKGLAERAMWSWMDKQKNIPFTLSSMNPAWCFGPYMGKADLSNLGQSIRGVWSLFTADAVPATDFAGFVDVRDVAKAVLLAAESPKAPGHRLLLGTHFDWQTAADIIREKFPEARKRVPEGCPRAGRTEPVYSLDGSTATRMLGFEYTPLGVTLEDTVSQLLEAEKRTKPLW